ncbi:Hypothetical protein (Fragment) [Durusdinium trenchii]|uniref:SET domain-containing protein n=1 Tax=Durusdinium trenchii TaxID=1381693 RepID=A0ABP0M3X5_9DINO
MVVNKDTPSLSDRDQESVPSRHSFAWCATPHAPPGGDMTGDMIEATLDVATEASRGPDRLSAEAGEVLMVSPPIAAAPQNGPQLVAELRRKCGLALATRSPAREGDGGTEARTRPRQTGPTTRVMEDGSHMAFGVKTTRPGRIRPLRARWHLGTRPAAPGVSGRWRDWRQGGARVGLKSGPKRYGGDSGASRCSPGSKSPEEVMQELFLQPDAADQAKAEAEKATPEGDLKLQEILNHNVFVVDHSGAAALYGLPSMLNHSCAVTALKLVLVFFEKAMIFVATQDLEKGAELCHRYFDVEGSVETRRGQQVSRLRPLWVCGGPRVEHRDRDSDQLPYERWPPYKPMAKRGREA